LKLLNQINLDDLVVSMLRQGNHGELDAFVRQFDSVVLDAIEIVDAHLGRLSNDRISM
jgi:hypothetical protein